MYSTTQLIEIYKDGILLEYITVDRNVRHDGEPILHYKLAVDEEHYNKSDYDILTFNDHKDTSEDNESHRAKELEKQGLQK